MRMGSNVKRPKTTVSRFIVLVAPLWDYTHTRARFSPAEGLDAEVIPLVAALDEADAGEAREGLQAAVDDGPLAGGCREEGGVRDTRGRGRSQGHTGKGEE